MQTGLTAEEKEQKEQRVFDEAMRRVKESYWRDLRFAGHQVNVQVVPSGRPPHPYGQDYQAVKKILGKSARQLSLQHPDILQLKQNAQHMDRRIGTTIFVKCSSCPHCIQNPIKTSPELMSTLRSFPSPSPSPSHPGHFTTYKESLQIPVNPCQHLPLYISKGFGRCAEDKYNYLFTSKAE
ncbi:uncharacterized protein LOC121425106 [Lytechinus variegatus]|uniref:uncharacterized protein LOC121425106 n=1 Tax=Lytechinus variegatus TaxID=7654 RepID=UPI001BB19323|nr:uncharacterized protein LOC121425106 [Lytechinus variegatus]